MACWVSILPTFMSVERRNVLKRHLSLHFPHGLPFKSLSPQNSLLRYSNSSAICRSYPTWIGCRPGLPSAHGTMEPGPKRQKSTLTLHVSLPSGRAATLEPLQGTVGDLKVAAQQALGQPFLRLAGPNGRLLDAVETLQEAGLQDGDSISAVALQPKLAANLASLCFVVCWR